MNAELKSCPFCGGTDGDIVGAPDRGYWAMCDSCGASTSEINNRTEADAIAAWNRRAAQAPQAAESIEEDAFPALHALTEAVLTRADADYMQRQLAEAVRIMATRGWSPSVPFPQPVGIASPARDVVHIYAGDCPDELHPTAFDPECPACLVIRVLKGKP